MARQLGVATHSLRRLLLRRQQVYTSRSGRIFFCSVSSSQPPNARTAAPSNSAALVHQSLVTTTPNLLALQRVQELLRQPQSRVLLLTGGGVSDSAVRAELEQDASVFELERRGHGIFGVREFCQLLLRESGRERRVFGRAQLAALLLHHADALSSSASRFAAVSTLQRRKRVQDLLQLFWLLEREGVTPEQYTATAGDSQTTQELADSYAKYQELLMQHNATSWDGLVMDVLAMCGVHKGGDVMAKEFSDGLLRQYTDVVVDDVQRMTPAMARLVGHLCAQPSVLSSASFSQVVLEVDDCPRTRILERQLLESSDRTGHSRTITQTTMKLDDETTEKRAKMHTFAQQLITSRSDGANSKKLKPLVVPSPVPLRCWRFGVSEAEERKIGAFIADTLKKEGTTHVTVLCPSYTDVHRITTAFKKQNLPVRVLYDQFSGAVDQAGAPVHLFDEPGVNNVYSLICALCFPSDSRHLYNVLRSQPFDFPPELLSWLMEKEHRSNADLFQVLKEFVESRGKSLFASLSSNDSEPPHGISLQLESGLETAESFVAIIKRLRGECHKLSAAEIVHSFLADTGRLETLLSPSSPEQERESLALASFLRELDTAQSVVNSAQVTFVAPYLQQLRESNLTLSTSWESLQEISDNGLDSDDGEPRVRVLPLTSRTLESLKASVKRNGEDRRVLVLMSMRDSKFPGRMKRLTLPLPYKVLSEPYPMQTRAEHLKHSEWLAYQAFTLDTYDEIILSYAELATTKREVLSRTFKPIWHEGDQPTASDVCTNSFKDNGDGSNNTTPPQYKSRKQAPAALTATTMRTELPFKASYIWYLEIAEYLRTFASRVFLPIWLQPVGSLLVGVSSRAKRHKNKQGVEGSEGQAATSSMVEVPDSAQVPLMPSRKLAYEPPHLSYSQISQYLRCPHRYFLARVMKLGGDTSASMMFGSALHESVAAFATALAAAQRRGDDAGNAKTLAGVEAEEAFVRAWASDGFGLFSSKEQAQFLFDRGILALWDFINAHFENPRAQEILHVEKDFSVDVPEANVELRGVWDRIDRMACDDGSFVYVIKEFKSNMSGAQRNMCKLAEESLQLKLYMYAFHKVFGEAPYGAQLQQIGGNYPQADTSIKKAASQRKTTLTGNEALVRFSDKAMQEAEAAVVKVASGLRNGDFDPTPSFSECAFCPYAGSACHFTTDAVFHEPRPLSHKRSA